MKSSSEEKSSSKTYLDIRPDKNRKTRSLRPHRRPRLDRRSMRIHRYWSRSSHHGSRVHTGRSSYRLDPRTRHRSDRVPRHTRSRRSDIAFPQIPRRMCRSRIPGSPRSWRRFYMGYSDIHPDQFGNQFLKTILSSELWSTAGQQKRYLLVLHPYVHVNIYVHVYVYMHIYVHTMHQTFTVLYL